MLRWLSKKIVNWQIEKSILMDEERAVYQYGYEVFLNQILNILIAIVIAVILRAPMPVFVFLVGYIPLRSYCGGYHANTNGGCIIVSALLICLVCQVTKNIRISDAAVLLPASFILSGILIFRFAPVPDRNKPLDELETIRYRSRSRLIWLAEAVIGMAFYFVYGKAGVVIAVSHIILSVMLCLGLLKNKKPNK